MPLQFSFVIRYFPYFFDGAVVTLELSVLTILIVLVWGLLVALSRLSQNPFLRSLAGGYIQIVRNTPILVQLYFIYFGFSMGGFPLSGFLSGLLALSLQNGAYVAEIYRGGLQSISSKQIEGARSLGMSRWLTLRLVVLPQAIARVIPALGNQFILIIKDTSLASVIAVAELTQAGKLLSERTAATYEIFLTLATFYLVMTSVVAGILHLYERRFALFL